MGNPRRGLRSFSRIGSSSGSRQSEPLQIGHRGDWPEIFDVPAVHFQADDLAPDVYLCVHLLIGEQGILLQEKRQGGLFSSPLSP